MSNPHPQSRLLLLVLVSVGVLCAGGCAALTMPVQGIPAHAAPEYLLAEPKNAAHTIDLSLLRQPPPDVYRLGAGDVLGIWIDGILGQRTASPPIHAALRENEQPGVGFPITVEEDGTISLPLIPPIPVAGLSRQEARARIVQAYANQGQMLQPGRDRVLVTLIRPRTYRVLVMRQDAGDSLAVTTEGGNTVLKPKRGTGHEVELPAYENDVLTALARTGGLPGLEAINRIFILRGGMWLSRPSGGTSREPQTVEIPLQLPPGEPLPFSPQNIILQDGDVVFIEAREGDVFYTGGLLPAGAYPLPRDYDLDVVEAIALVQGTLANGGVQTTNLVAGSFIQEGIGGPSPSLVIILRRTPDGGQVPIRVDLNKALQDARERVLIQPRDVIILQQTPGEGFARYVARVINFFADWRIWTHADSTGVFTTSLP